jgi:DNA invertase Pin-like site-specific DNA recombinase
MSRRAGLYARISLDRTGESEAPERQLADAEHEALRRGWEVVDRYVDRESAFSPTAKRAQYNRLLHDLRTGRIDAVVCWKLDRLTRQGTRGMGKFLDVLGDNELVSVTEAFLDTTTPMGRAVLMLIASLAEQESENTALRVKRAQKSAAQRGDLPGGGYRIYGLRQRTKHGVMPGGGEPGTIVPHEAAIIRECMERILKGQSLRSIAFDLNDRGITTSTGGQWRSRTLGQMLKSPTLAALRKYDDELLDGNWEPIITKEEHFQLVAALSTRLAERREPSRSHLLSGIIHCDVCKQPMRHMWFTMKNGRRFERYQCLDEPGHKQCGKVAITSKSTDAYVTQELLDWMADYGFHPLSDETSIEALDEQLAADQQALYELVRARFVDRTIPNDAYVSARDTLQQSIGRNEALKTRLDVRLPLGDRVALQQWWDQASSQERQQVARERIARVLVKPAQRRGGNKFDPTRLDVEFIHGWEDLAPVGPV